MLRLLASSLLLFAVVPLALAAEPLAELAPIPRRLPAKGIAVPEEKSKELSARLAVLKARVEKLDDTKHHRPDIEVLTKAVDLALRYGEFYNEKDFAKADWALKLAEERLGQAEKGEFPWLTATGPVVRGYRSPIDDSVQPYGLVVPTKEKFDPTAPLYLWLHGRGEQQTDLHFLHGRAHGVGDIAPEGAIVAHPFGRQCIGWKSAGEVDALDVVRAIEKERKDRTSDKRVLMGFSMGGAGVWHIASHYPTWWDAAGPGAGFSETAKFMKYKPADLPPEIEQTLWRNYDVPDYVRNLFNLPVIAYSGEIDGQIQAARVMEEAFEAQGKKLPHLIGPKTAHSVHPETKKEWLKQIDSAARAHAYADIKTTTFQTQSLRYAFGPHCCILGMEKHWTDARLDIDWSKENQIVVTTKNVTRFLVQRRIDGIKAISIDGRELPFATGNFKKTENGWEPFPSQTQYFSQTPGGPLFKRPFLQGPIDDAFLEPFLVVAPTGQSNNPQVERWVKFELDHLRDRWRAVFRGELRVKNDTEVTDEDLAKYHVVCWGDYTSNKLLAKMKDKLPLTWSDKELAFRGKTYDAAGNVPVFCYPNPLRGGKYVVVNSGPTFREFDDANNSLQNPKLGDWAVIDLSVAPNNRWPGKVAAAGFFDEEWK